jgi:RimJ/RimL family protein N-acetyltransferase
VIETPRLLLRRWRGSDIAPYAAMMGDPAVGDWLGGTLNPAQARAKIDGFEAAFETHGMGRLAIERLADGRLIGHCGLMPAHPEIPFAPAVEAGWALVPEAWGQGYAVEAARAVLADGFDRLGLAEIVAYTTAANLRSQAVMAGAGFIRDAARDFDHPALADDHPLRSHLVYAAQRPDPQ